MIHGKATRVTADEPTTHATQAPPPREENWGSRSASASSSGTSTSPTISSVRQKRPRTNRQLSRTTSPTMSAPSTDGAPGLLPGPGPLTKFLALCGLRRLAGTRPGTRSRHGSGAKRAPKCAGLSSGHVGGPVAVERGVQAPAGHELLVRSLLDDLAVLEHDDQVGAADRREPVGDHERRPPREQRP